MNIKKIIILTVICISCSKSNSINLNGQWITSCESTELYSYRDKIKFKDGQSITTETTYDGPNCLNVAEEKVTVENYKILDNKIQFEEINTKKVNYSPFILEKNILKIEDAEFYLEE